MTIADATTRFSTRVDDYVKYRPHYPIELIDVLAARCGLLPESVVVDVGAGTGILTQLFLENGNPVVGIEPNKEMREAAETLLAEFARFTSVGGSAEATKLPAQVADFIVVGQAFHWFDRDKARAEFLRILKSDGILVLIWNDRQIESTPFLRDYEKLLNDCGNDYQEIQHKTNLHGAAFQSFFGAPVYEATLANSQRVDRDGLIGRLHSVSYMPAKGEAKYAGMRERANEIFDAHEKSGVVEFLYDTKLFFGRMG